jgi:hypothetical protein
MNCWAILTESASRTLEFGHFPGRVSDHLTLAGPFKARSQRNKIVVASATVDIPDDDSSVANATPAAGFFHRGLKPTAKLKRRYRDEETDGNWLNMTAHCCSHGADVWTTGAILHLSDVARWLIALEEMNRSLRGEASLVNLEPNWQWS